MFAAGLDVTVLRSILKRETNHGEILKPMLCTMRQLKVTLCLGQNTVLIKVTCPYPVIIW